MRAAPVRSRSQPRLEQAFTGADADSEGRGGGTHPARRLARGFGAGTACTLSRVSGLRLPRVSQPPGRLCPLARPIAPFFGPPGFLSPSPGLVVPRAGAPSSGRRGCISAGPAPSRGWPCPRLRPTSGTHRTRGLPVWLVSCGYATYLAHAASVATGRPFRRLRVCAAHPATAAPRRFGHAAPLRRHHVHDWSQQGSHAMAPTMPPSSVSRRPHWRRATQCGDGAESLPSDATCGLGVRRGRAAARARSWPAYNAAALIRALRRGSRSSCSGPEQATQGRHPCRGQAGDVLVPAMSVPASACPPRRPSRQASRSSTSCRGAGSWCCARWPSGPSRTEWRSRIQRRSVTRLAGQGGRPGEEPFRPLSGPGPLLDPMSCWAAL